jgi:hypothetical protein
LYRPYPIVVGSIMTPERQVSPKFFPFEFTPLYVGMPPVADYTKPTALGGGFVEPIGFNTLAPRRKVVSKSGNEVRQLLQCCHFCVMDEAAATSNMFSGGCMWASPSGRINQAQCSREGGVVEPIGFDTLAPRRKVVSKSGNEVGQSFAAMYTQIAAADQQQPPRAANHSAVCTDSSTLSGQQTILQSALNAMSALSCIRLQPPTLLLCIGDVAASSTQTYLIN